MLPSLRASLGVLLVGIFLFQSTVYPLHLWLQLQQQQHRQFTATEKAATLCLKIPLSLPYASNWEAPLETNGLLEHNGVFYNLYKKDFRHDTLYVYYVKNNNARELFSTLATYVKEQQDATDDSLPNKWPLKWEKTYYLLAELFDATQHIRSGCVKASVAFYYHSLQPQTIGSDILHPPQLS